MRRYVIGFDKVIKGVDFGTLENSPHSIHAIDREMRLVYFNQAWLAFAKENQGDSLLKTAIPGTSVLAFFNGQLVKRYYEEKYKEVLKIGEVWHNDYECSSSEKYRLYHQTAYPLNDRTYLLIVNALRIDLPIDEVRKEPMEPILSRYMQENGFINQCTNCRQVQRAELASFWDWVPEWVDQPPIKTSHTICPHCFDYYWKYKSVNRK